MTDQLDLDPSTEPPPSLRVRPYTVTGGRTRADIDLEIETMVRATVDSGSQSTVDASDVGGGRSDDSTLVSEAKAILALCATPQSVAEISAHLRLPLQVVKVLVSDLVSSKRATTHGAAPEPGARPDLALLERVLDGLQSL